MHLLSLLINLMSPCGIKVFFTKLKVFCCGNCWRFSWFCHRVLCLTYLLYCKDEKCRWKNISALHRSPLTVLESLLMTVQMLDHCVSTTINDHCEVYGTTDKPFMRAEQKRTQRHHHLHSWKKVSMCLWLCQGSVLSVKGRSAYLHLTKPSDRHQDSSGHQIIESWLWYLM